MTDDTGTGRGHVIHLSIFDAFISSECVKIDISNLACRLSAVSRPISIRMIEKYSAVYAQGQETS